MYLNFVKTLILSITGVFLSSFACATFFRVTEMPIYRIVAVFLTLILISNFSAKIVIAYFNTRNT